MIIDNKVAFVTGANRGFGLAIAKALLARGARKVYAGMRTRQDLGIPGLVPVTLDVLDPGQVAQAAALATDTEILVNNAGIARILPSSIAAETETVAREIFETNYFGLVRTSSAFAPVLAANGGGAIVNILSVASWISRPALGAYAASKSAAWSFTNALRVELKEQGTKVLGLHVGFMDTDLTDGIAAPKSDPALIAERTLDGLEADLTEVLADDITRAVKNSLSSTAPIYLDPPQLG